MTGCRISRTELGANSMMKSATKTEQKKLIATAAPVVRIVLQSSGQAWNCQWNGPPWSPERKIVRIWLSTFPPGPNQCSPLWANDGHAAVTTQTSIASTTARTPHARAAPGPPRQRPDGGAGRGRARGAGQTTTAVCPLAGERRAFVSRLLLVLLLG